MNLERAERCTFNLVHRSIILLLTGFLFTVLLLPVYGRADSANTQDEAGKDGWSTGYWIWRMSERQSGRVFKGAETDLLYVDAGSLNTLWATPNRE